MKKIISLFQWLLFKEDKSYLDKLPRFPKVRVIHKEFVDDVYSVFVETYWDTTHLPTISKSIRNSKSERREYCCAIDPNDYNNIESGQDLWVIPAKLSEPSYEHQKIPSRVMKGIPVNVQYLELANAISVDPISVREYFVRLDTLKFSQYPPMYV